MKKTTIQWQVVMQDKHFPDFIESLLRMGRETESWGGDPYLDREARDILAGFE
jgi:hypothetical protein